MTWIGGDDAGIAGFSIIAAGIGIGAINGSASGLENCSDTAVNVILNAHTRTFHVEHDLQQFPSPPSPFLILPWPHEVLLTEIRVAGERICALPSLRGT